MNSKDVRLLVAEDEDSIRDGIRNYVRVNTTVFTETLAAATGQEALDLIYGRRPQVMLLDIQMPVKDGLTVLKEASAAGVCPKTIILSGHDAFTYAQQAIRYGVADYLLKPVRSAEILEKLEKLAAGAPESARPLPPGSDAQGAALNPLVARALDFMRERYAEPLSQPMVAEFLGVTPGYLSTLFTQDGRGGFAERLNRIRVERACDCFAGGRMKTYEAAFQVGFQDEKYFSSVFKKIMGVTPSQYRNALNRRDDT